MEISLKSNLTTKVLAVILVILLILGLSALFNKVKATEEGENETVATEKAEDKKEDKDANPEIKLNRTVQFKGNTYKSFREGSAVKKELKEGETGTGVIFIIRKNQPYGIYLFGKGWIAESQVVNSKKFVNITFKLGKEGLTGGLTVEGEFTNIDLENTGILKYEDGKLIAVANGSTNIVITKKDGTKINAVAATHNGDITLTLAEGTISGQFAEAATIVDKVVVEASGKGQAGIAISSEGLTAAANGSVDLKLKTTDGQEIINGKIEGNGKVNASLGGLTVGGDSTQSISILAGKIKAALKERAEAKINDKQVSVGVGGSATVGDKEIVNGDGTIEYTYTKDDPTGEIKISVLGNKLLDKQGTIPIISAMKALVKGIAKVATPVP